jgi:hypothetical protein
MVPANPFYASHVDALVQTLRDAASREPDANEARSLLQSAQTIERADRDLCEEWKRLAASVEQAQTTVQQFRRRDRLPAWAVIAVLFTFLAFLVYVAIKHHVG